MMRTNPMKRKLERGECALGVSMMIPSPQVVEMVALLGFDWVLLDCEHGTMSPESLEAMVLAAEARGITTIGRPRSSRSEEILELLERGVGGVQVPHVSTVQEASEVVRAVRCEPLGQRGLAARTRPAAYGLSESLADYAEQANEETLVCVQLEDRNALRDIEEILGVPGIDVFFLGPSDLSQAFGHTGAKDHPDVVEAMRTAFTAIQRRGRIAGSAGDVDHWHTYHEQGATYLYTHLPGILAEGSKPYLEGAVS